MCEIKKVLFVATIASHIKGFHEPYLKLFKENGYKTYVAAKDNLKDNECIKYCDKFINISVNRSPFKLNNIKAIEELKNIIKLEKINVIHCHTPVGSVVARLAAKKDIKKGNVRLIYTAHGFHFFKGAPIKNWLLFYPIELYLAKYTTTLITINSEDYEFAKKKFSKRCNDIIYIPGVGIDINKFKSKMSIDEIKKYKKSLGIGEKDYILTCVARLDKNKNQKFLIQVINNLKDKNIHLILVGRDEIGGLYQKIVKEKKLENKVHFLGNRNDISNILSITDIVLSASKREGLPINILEAFASGKPVVALNCRGMTDLIEDEKNGFIVRNKDIEEYIGKILKIYNDKKLYENIKINNLEKASKYDISIISKEYKKYIIGDKIDD